MSLHLEQNKNFYHFSLEFHEKWLFNKKEISKREFTKIIRLAVEIRNKAAHELFITYSNFLPSLVIKPNKNFVGSDEEYYVEMINLILSIFGEKGIESRIKKIMNKYKKYLKFSYFTKK